MNGNSTWGSCGSGAPAGITYATTALNWTQTIFSPLTGGTQATVALTPCPVGIDTTSGAGHQVLLSGGGNSEAVNVLAVSGGCTSGGTSGTITFTPFYSYSSGYTISSASSGVQETLNAACGVNTVVFKNSQCNVTIPANGPFNSVNTYNVLGTIYLHSNQSVLNGYGTSLNCLGRGACLQVGDLKNSNDFTEALNFKHPNVHREMVEYAETQKLHIVSVYSNPCRWQRRREAFHDFRFHMEASPNVELHVVEVAFGDRPHEVTSSDNPFDLQLRTDSSLWIKECAINEGVRRFPAGWQYGGYVDGDFHFTRHDWALEAIHMLQHHSFVQLFSAYADLTGETTSSHLGHRPYRMSASFAWNYMHQTEFLKSRRTRRGGADTYYAPLQPSASFPFGHAPGATGGAWSWRRDAFDMVGGMLDTCILGSADWHQAFGLVQATNVASEARRCSQAYVETLINWQARAAKLNRVEGRSPIGCIDNFATHAFHGSKSLRAYGERWGILQKWDFNPATDIARDCQGLWRWTGNKPGLRDEVAQYFVERSEDGPLLLGATPLV